MIIKEILEVLEHKKQLFLDLEKKTEDMNTLDFQDLVDRIEERNLILKEIEIIDANIKEKVIHDNRLKNILNNTINRDELNEDELSAYLLVLEIKAVVNRIMQYDDLIRMHLDFEKHKILERVENLNTSSSSVAEKYQKSIETGVNKPVNSIKNNTI